MINRQVCIERIKANSGYIQQNYGVRSLRLFGSMARDEVQGLSDVDVFVEMAPKLFQMVGLKYYLEDLLGTNVDIVRKHRNNDAFLLHEIEKDGIDIIGETTIGVAYS